MQAHLIHPETDELLSNEHKKFVLTFIFQHQFSPFPGGTDIIKLFRSSSQAAAVSWSEKQMDSSTFSACGELLRETEGAVSFLASHITHPLTLNVALTFCIAMAASHVYHSCYCCCLRCFQKLFKT